MSYAEMLTQIIEESDLSLRQITNRCAALNLNITPSYISQLKNGKLPPPSEEVSLTLAKACGAKEQAQLVFQGYMEKAPEMVREYMAASSTINKALLESLAKISGSQQEVAQTHEFLKSIDVLAAMDISSKFLDSESGGSVKDLIRNIAEACGAPSEADTKGEQTHLYLGDDSMEPTIPEHSFVAVMPTKPDLLKDRDMIAFYPENRRTPVLRRLFFIKGKVLLLPDSKDHECFFYDSFEEVQYVGKVISYKVDL